MRLLFLDIDGVLTSDTTTQNPNFLYTFSKDCVDVLNHILLKHDVKIILTSSWRYVFGIEQQIQIFKENKVVQNPYNQTEDLGYEERHLEIKKYLKNKKVTHFVILDDMEIIDFPNNFVKIDPRTGLTKHHIDKIDLILAP